MALDRKGIACQGIRDEVNHGLGIVIILTADEVPDYFFAVKAHIDCLDKMLRGVAYVMDNYCFENFRGRIIGDGYILGRVSPGNRIEHCKETDKK